MATINYIDDLFNTGNVSNNQVKFRIEITEAEWGALEEAARKNGKSNARRFITTELHRYANENGDINLCNQGRRIAYFPLPPEILPFYQRLSDFMNIPVATAIYRMVVLPHITKNLALEDCRCLTEN